MKSIIKFTPKREDNGKQISCKAENPRMRAHSKEDNIFLSISCKYNFIFLCIDRFQTLCFRIIFNYISFRFTYFQIRQTWLSNGEMDFELDILNKELMSTWNAKLMQTQK